MTKRFFINFDKAGAEWVIVAYLADDARMIDVIESGKSPHIVTGSLISRAPEALVQREHELIKEMNNPAEIEEERQKLPELLKGNYFLPRSMSIRQAGKKSNHALNYDETYRVFALYNEMEESDAKVIVNNYKTIAYPNVPVWHESIRNELKGNNRTLENCFGRKVRLLGPWDQRLFKKAYSFKPQSTNVDMVNRAIRLAYRDDSKTMNQFWQMVQVHDSVLAQMPVPSKKARWLDIAKACVIMDGYLSPMCVYSQREFVVKTDVKVGAVNWQTMSGVKITPDIDKLAAQLHKAYDETNK